MAGSRRSATAAPRTPGAAGTRSAEPLAVARPDGLRHLSHRHAQAFLGLVRAADAVARALDQDLQESHRLTLRGYEVLLHLAAFSPDGRLRVSQLVEQAPLSQSRVSRLVAELESRGLVRRSTAKADSRGVEVAITGPGRELLREASETHLAGLERYLFGKLTWQETQQLARITTKLLAEPL